MNRIVSFVLSLILLFSACNIVFFTNAVNMTVDEPEEVFEGDKSIVFLTRLSIDDAHDQYRWYTFTPERTAFYMFKITNPFYSSSTVDTYMTVFDSYVEAVNDEYESIEFIDLETMTVTIRKTLNEGQTYYIKIYCSSSLEFDTPHEMTLTIERHTQHQYVDTIVPPTYFKKGYTSHHCSICEDTYKDNYKDRLSLGTPKGFKATQTEKGEKKILVKYKKVAAATGYYIQYSVKKNMRGAKTIAVSSPNTVKKTISGLKLNTKYYIRVRAYKAIDGKKIYSAFTSIKTVKMK